MTDDGPTSLTPAYYASTVRTLLRYAVVMAVLALLSGIAYQESARKLDHETAPPGLHLEAVLQLALVHGHAFLLGVLLPIAMAGTLVLARGAGGTEVGRLPLRVLTRGYLPAASVTVALMIAKGYHVLLRVRAGETDLDAVGAAFLGGHGALRYGIYGLAHGLTGLALAWFLVAVWRSLRPR